MEKIYTLTTIRGLKGDLGTRCVGWFPTYDQALKTVEFNDLDINEDGYYPYAVIEETGPGLYCLDRRETWFQWIDDGYKKIEKPTQIKCIVCFGMG